MPGSLCAGNQMQSKLASIPEARDILRSEMLMMCRVCIAKTGHLFKYMPIIWGPLGKHRGQGQLLNLSLQRDSSVHSFLQSFALFWSLLIFHPFWQILVSWGLGVSIFLTSVRFDPCWSCWFPSFLYHPVTLTETSETQQPTRTEHVPTKDHRQGIHPFEAARCWWWNNAPAMVSFISFNCQHLVRKTKFVLSQPVFLRFLSSAKWSTLSTANSPSECLSLLNLCFWFLLEFSRQLISCVPHTKAY